MRLDKNEIENIKDLSQICFGNGSKVILFGSRVDDSLKGGDIDLYIVPRKKMSRSERRKERIKYLVYLKSKIGDQKIDLILSEDDKRAIEREALETGIEL